MSWIQIVLFILQNAPALIKLIKEIVDSFGSRAEAKEALSMVSPAFKKAVVDGDTSKMREILEQIKVRRGIK